VTLPYQAHALIQRQLEVQPRGARRVLIVEDQDDAREMLRVLIESAGHIVLEEVDGTSAVRAIEREHPDIAFIDIGLPAMNGYEVARSVRQNRSLDDVVLVALTGYGRDTDIQAANAAGFDAHVTKPADFHLIDEILARKIWRQKAS
jgi:CheY-like chemotaxis protein